MNSISLLIKSVEIFVQLSTTIGFLFIVDCIYCISSLQFCYLIWTEVQRIQTESSLFGTTTTVVWKNWNQFEACKNWYLCSNTSEEAVYTFEPINHVAKDFFSDTDLILDSSPDSSEKKHSSLSAPSVSEKTS